MVAPGPGETARILFVIVIEDATMLRSSTRQTVTARSVPRRVLLAVLMLIGVLAPAGLATAPPATAIAPLIYKLTGTDGASKVLSVTSNGWGDTTATAIAWERDADGIGWRQVGGPWPATVGYGGWALTPGEATGRSPVGSFSFGTGFGMAGNPGYRLGWFDIGPTDYWVEDPSAGAAYNTRQQGPPDPALAPWGHFERLADYPAQYRYAALINFNVPVTGYGRGSGIFLHVSTGGPTAGCVGLPTPALLWVMRWIDAGTRIVMGPTSAVTRGPVGAIEAAWWNGSADPGAPTTPEWPTPTKPGAFRHFERASIYWSAATGAHLVAGAIRDRWAASGWENGSLGFPLTDQLTAPDGAGRFNHFQGGSIYWSPSTGAHVVAGAVRDAWAARGWEQGRLGYPTAEEAVGPAGRLQRFSGGSVFVPSGSPATDARVGYVPTASEQRVAAVQVLYREALGREVDPGGLSYWVRLLEAGARFDDVAAAVWGSTEAYVRAGGAPEPWVSAVYGGLLGRVPDAAGLAWWSSVALNDRGGVVRAIYNAPESAARRVDDAYQSTLGRMPDPAGRAYWQGQIVILGDAVLFDVLGHSPEAFSRLEQSLMS